MAESGFKSPTQLACQTVLHPLNLLRLLSLRNKGPSLTQEEYYTLQSSFPSWPHWVQFLGDGTIRLIPLCPPCPESGLTQLGAESTYICYFEKSVASQNLPDTSYRGGSDQTDIGTGIVLMIGM